MAVGIGERLRNGTAAFGATLTIHEPFVAEVMAARPLDFLMVDTEHSPLSAVGLQTQLIALRSATAAVLVRVPHLDPTAIMQALDLGADGVVVPHVETAADASAAVSAAFYPPLGDRGFGPRRAQRLPERAPYLSRANEDTLLVVMIESRSGVENLADILAVQGVGGVIIGVADLAASLGHLGDQRHPDVGAAVDEIVDGCLVADVPFGLYAPTPEAARRWVDRGARLLTVGSDLLFLEQGMSRVLEAVAPVDRTPASRHLAAPRPT
ncbi:HpcH/HpaI aldolase family protein [Pseudonocardia dioxanivorans]|jgi:2-keto-3-deoxy-L-rhamnonate aldolase RhmA|uniref:HpcH/HpaI aldolase family protein n=1 Tax=Pseudonocardia dioxanivorans TaxID=240495 RepID=UPI00140445B8|nr:aldolase/citrate lyase family protein [Pseudonocardia dioxanivorans]